MARANRSIQLSFKRSGGPASKFRALGGKVYVDAEDAKKGDEVL